MSGALSSQLQQMLQSVPGQQRPAAATVAPPPAPGAQGAAFMAHQRLSQMDKAREDAMAKAAADRGGVFSLAYQRAARMPHSGMFRR